MTLRTIRLELARCRDFPDGSPAHGYEFQAPLDRSGHFDGTEWDTVREKCTVRRFWDRDADETGKLVQHRGHHWAFSYDPATTDDDEPIFRFDRHVFKEGEYVSITEHDGVERTFKVIAVQ
jgi:hypothetical protein